MTAQEVNFLIALDHTLGDQVLDLLTEVKRSGEILRATGVSISDRLIQEMAEVQLIEISRATASLEAILRVIKKRVKEENDKLSQAMKTKIDPNVTPGN